MFFLIQLIIVFQVASATDYCKICENGTHTMCLFNEGPGPNCLDYKKIEITDQMKKSIVDIHNDIRNHVASGRETRGRLGGQPPAADMSQLVWDEELSLMAQRWADQCVNINATFQHDFCRKTDRFDVGQNILTAVTINSNLPELANLILSWYKQVSDVIPSDIKYFSGIRRGQLVIGQYTQLVWAKTEYVGCALSVFKESKNNKVYNHRFICNYGPAGNVIGAPIYQIGRPCSKCPSKECDIIRSSLCRGSDEMSAMSSEIPFNFTLEDSLLMKNYHSICFILPDESSQATMFKCKHLLNDLVINQQESERSTHPLSKVLKRIKKLDKPSNRNNPLGEINHDVNVINLIQRIKGTSKDEVSNLISDEDLDNESRRGKEECFKYFGIIQNKDYTFKQKSTNFFGE
ncbi:venom allergen 3 isoform X3 [Leptinotarsa decemlineata]|uniref:venom allergen 3 isoform X3 n=1 Tax=Leptinotarsa decemlineata TaxID=7539 RepID=UPI003D3053DF